MGVHNFSATAMNGQEVNLAKYEGKTLLIVNTASQCGFTFQYEDLQRLYDRYKDKDFVILGFPCNQFAGQEPDDNEKVQFFCTLRYGVTFPMFQKVNVRDEDAHPLFNYLSTGLPFEGFNESHPVAKILIPLLKEKHPEYLYGDSIKWNFTKFLIDKKVKPVKRYEATTDPLDIEQDIELLLKY